MAKQENEELWARSIVKSFWITLTGTICVVIYIVVLAQDLPSIELLENFDPDLVTRIYSSDGKIIKIRWRLDGQLPHDTELFYKKVKRCIRDGLYEHTPAN